MRTALRLTLISAVLPVMPPVVAETGADAVCAALIDDEQTQLADYELDVELAQSRLAAFEKICSLINDLWEREAIERMIWLRARHDRDAARLELERARLILARQQSHVDQLRLGCDASAGDRADRIRAARQRFLRADCDQQAKAIEIAKVNLEFNREWLASIRKLREGATGTATIQDVILAERDVRLEEQRLADARARTDACRKRIASD